MVVGRPLCTALTRAAPRPSLSLACAHTSSISAASRNCVCNNARHAHTQLATRHSSVALAPCHPSLFVFLSRGAPRRLRPRPHCRHTNDTISRCAAPVGQSSVAQPPVAQHPVAQAAVAPVRAPAATARSAVPEAVPSAAQASVFRNTFNLWGRKKTTPAPQQSSVRQTPLTARPSGDLFASEREEELEIPSFLRRQNR